MRCRSLIIGPQGRYLGPRAPSRVESEPTPTDQRLHLRHARPHSADSCEGLERARSQGWAAAGSLFLIVGSQSPFSYIPVLTLVPDKSWTQKRHQRRHDSQSSSSPLKRKWTGAAYVPTWGLPGMTAGARHYGNLGSSIFIRPWVLLAQCVRARDVSSYESKSSSPQTKPSLP